MQRHGNETRLETDDARSGTTNHGVRYVLGIGLALAIIALSFIWITGALTGPQGTGENPAERQSVK